MKAFWLILSNQYELQGSLFSEKIQKASVIPTSFLKILHKFLTTDGFVYFRFRVNSPFKMTLGLGPRTQVAKSLVSRNSKDAINNSENAPTYFLPSESGSWVPKDSQFQFQDQHHFLLVKYYGLPWMMRKFSTFFINVFLSLNEIRTCSICKT